MNESNPDARYLSLAADIVSAHVANNAVQADALPELIQSVYRTLAAVAGDVAAASGTTEKPPPAVPVKRSVFPDYIVCLEDGKKLSMLRRHLKTAYNLTPDQYRARWGLPFDYPMVAPNYSSRRSALAKEIGLGQKKTIETEVPEAVAPKLKSEVVVTNVRARRARGSRG